MTNPRNFNEAINEVIRLVGREKKVLVSLYLAVVAATLFVSGELGPWASVVDSGVGIGLAMVLRARLHDLWQTHRLLRMGTLIAAGGLAAYLVNVDHPQVALASVSAFALASLTASGAYERLRASGWRRRLLGSHVVFAATDSLIFPAIAFGGFDWAITGGQFGAKVVGAVLYGELFRRQFAEHDAQVRDLRRAVAAAAELKVN